MPDLRSIEELLSIQTYERGDLMRLLETEPIFSIAGEDEE